VELHFWEADAAIKGVCLPIFFFEKKNI